MNLHVAKHEIASRLSDSVIEKDQEGIFWYLHQNTELVTLKMLEIYPWTHAFTGEGDKHTKRKNTQKILRSTATT